MNNNVASVASVEGGCAGPLASVASMEGICKETGHQIPAANFIFGFRGFRGVNGNMPYKDKFR